MGRFLLGKDPNTLSARAVLRPFDARPGVPFGEGPEVPILQLQGCDEDAEALIVVVQPVFEDRPPATDGGPRSFPLPHGPCVALVEWGTGAVTCRAEIDIAKGTCFTIAGSTVIIKGRNDGRVRLIPILDSESPPPDRSIDPEPGAQPVLAMIAGTGTRASLGRATRTYYQAALEEDGFATFLVPPFAKAVRVQRSPALEVGIAVEDGFSTAAQRDGEYVVAAGALAPRIDLVDSADVVVVRNAGTEELEFLQVQFELAL